MKGQITWLHCSPQGLSFRRIVKMLNLRLNSKEEVVEEEENKQEATKVHQLWVEMKPCYGASHADNKLKL